MKAAHLSTSQREMLKSLNETSQKLNDEDRNVQALITLGLIM